MPDAADCSVVVIALAGGSALEQCLAALATMHARCHVLLGEDRDAMRSLPDRYPGVRVSSLATLTVPQRREHGLRQATSELVAILEDTSQPDAGWLAAVAAAFTDAATGAASGPVSIDPALPARAQALGCVEYARFHPRLFGRLALGGARPDGTRPVSRLPGNNLAYRRSAILGVLQPGGAGLLESEAHAALMARGLVLALQPGMGVTYRAADPRGLRLATRFHHGRLYAGARSAAWPMPRRMAWAGAAALLLPGLLIARALAAMLTAVRPRSWAAAAPWICAMEASWAAGEATGYLAGGGHSLRQWR